MSEHVEAPNRRQMSVRTCRNPECGKRYVVVKGTRSLPGCPACTPTLDLTLAPGANLPDPIAGRDAKRARVS